MARTEIGSIIDALVEIEKGLTGAEAVYDETPLSVAATPAWLNFPLTGELNEGSQIADDHHTLGCACVKREGLLPADEALMRPMITRFADALSDNLTLNGTVTLVQETTYEYGLIEILSAPDDPMFGILFRVRVFVDDNVDVST